MRSLKLVLLLFFLTFAVSCGQQKKYIEYKVKKGETMRTIAKKLDMKTRDLLRLNPDVSRRPDANTIIIVPNKKGVNTKVDTKKEKEIVDQVDQKDENKEESTIENDTDDAFKGFVTHKVKKGDTFYSLTRFYNVTEEDLKTLNPVLSEGLKLGQIIKIKPKEEDEENLFYQDDIKEGIHLKVALLLPFRAKKYDTLTPEKIFKKNKLTNIVTDFYLGAALAIDSLKKQGVVISLQVYDTEKKNTKIREILSENNLNENDVIIGPMYASEAKITANKVAIPVVFPVFSKSQSTFASSKLIKTAPDKEEYATTLVDYLKSEYHGENIVIVSDKWKRAATIKTMLSSHDSIDEIKIITPEKGYIAKERLIKLLSPNQNNWILLATSNNVVASDAINSLISLPEEMKVRVFAVEKGTIYDKIDNQRLAQIGFTFVTDTFVDENSFATQLFNQQYQEKNNTFPSYFATKGFDITYDVLMRLASGNPLKSTFKKGVSYRVESKFDFDKSLFKPTKNKGLFIVKYNPDLTLTRLK